MVKYQPLLMHIYFFYDPEGREVDSTKEEDSIREEDSTREGSTREEEEEGTWYLDSLVDFLAGKCAISGMVDLPSEYWVSFTGIASSRYVP